MTRLHVDVQNSEPHHGGFSFDAELEWDDSRNTVDKDSASYVRISSYANALAMLRHCWLTTTEMLRNQEHLDQLGSEWETNARAHADVMFQAICHLQSSEPMKMVRGPPLSSRLLLRSPRCCFLRQTTDQLHVVTKCNKAKQHQPRPNAFCKHEIETNVDIPCGSNVVHAK